MWYSAKCIFQHKKPSNDSNIYMYEERVIIVESKTADWAIKKAEDEANKYAANEQLCEYLGYIDCFTISESNIKDRSEIYSLMRSSNLEPDDYISKYYQDGTETSQKHIEFEHDIDADIIAIGKFSDIIAGSLEYDKNFYKNVKKGSRVVVSSLFYVSGENRMKLLADCLGIDHLNLNQHEIDLQKVNFIKLKSEFDEYDFKKFMTLSKAGFTFHFMMYFNDNGSDYLEEQEGRSPQLTK